MNLRELWCERKVRWASVLLFGLLLAAFLPAASNDFTNYDDNLYVTKNAQVQQGLTWESAHWAFCNVDVSNWHPLTWLSHILDCQFFGLRAWGHHLTSVWLHALNGVLAFAVLRRMTGAVWRSFIVALLFGLHPLRVESVAWVAERKDVLSTSFWMLTLWAYARFAQLQTAGVSQGPGLKLPAGPRPGFYYWLSLVFFSLGLMSKPMLVTVPCLLLLLDYWPLGRWGRNDARRLVAEKAPFFLAAAAASAVTFVVQRQGGAMANALPLAARLANIPVAYCRYLGKLFWPVELAPFYPPAHWPPGTVALAGGLLAALTTAAVLLRRSRPYFLVGWLWFIGTLIPVIGLVPAGEQSMADRYSYVPSIGILVVLVWGACELSGRWRHQAFGAAATAAVAALVCFCLTREQVGYWKNSETLFRHALLVTRNNYLAHGNLGMVLQQQGLTEQAMAEYREALKENPEYPVAHLNLAAALAGLGRPAEAAGQLLEALRAQPDFAEAHFNLGILLQEQGRLEEAVREYERALRLKLPSADAHYNLGIALVRVGRSDEAIAHFEKALKLEPSSADAHFSLGLALSKKGLLDEAIIHYRQALRLMPDDARAHFYLGLALSGKGQLQEAINEFARTLEIKPDHAEARTNLAILLSMKKRPGRSR
jgi:tetratricopeptide (TPR) repeat protein